MLRPDIVSIVHFTPELRRLCAELIVIFDRGGARVAKTAVKTAIADQFFHIPDCLEIVFICRQHVAAGRVCLSVVYQAPEKLGIT